MKKRSKGVDRAEALVEALTEALTEALAEALVEALAEALEEALGEALGEARETGAACPGADPARLVDGPAASSGGESSGAAVHAPLRRGLRRLGPAGACAPLGAHPTHGGLIAGRHLWENVVFRITHTSQSREIGRNTVQTYNACQADVSRNRNGIENTQQRGAAPLRTERVETILPRASRGSSPLYSDRAKVRSAAEELIATNRPRPPKRPYEIFFCVPGA